jgi:enterochelin esterase family protein
MRRVALLAWLLFAGAALGQDMPLSQVLIDGEGWKEVKVGRELVGPLAADHKGNLFFSESGGTNRLDTEGKTEVIVKCAHHAACVDGKGRLYTRVENGRAVYLHGDNHDPIELPKQTGDIAYSPAGKLYYVDRETKAVMLHGRKEPVAEKTGDPAGLAFWKDGGTLVVGDSAGNHLYAFRVRDDGTLDAKEKYYTLRVRPKQPSGVKALVIDASARLYAATDLGVQVFDPTGRLCGVLSSPLREPVTALAFAGEKRDQLFVICGGKLYQRKTKARAAWPPDAK